MTTRVIYYRPDYVHILNEMTLQHEDLAPRLPRVRAFLEHWRREVRATIESITVCHSDTASEWRHSDWEQHLCP